MNTIFLFLLAFLLVYLLVPVAIRVCLKYGFLDTPSRRKVHTKAMPRLGGVAVVISFVIALLCALALDGAFRVVFAPKLTGFLSAILIIFILGVWDDIKGTKAVVKLFFQCIAALILFYSGLKIYVFTNPFGPGELQLPFFLSLFITMFWIIGMINAINIIDGLDGLASGIVLISGIFILCAGIYLNTTVTVILLSILCGCAFGFLFFNFPPAKIFLGDTGSMFLGLVLATTGLAGLQYKVVTTVALIIPVTVLAIPVYDTILSIWRRILNKSSIFIADKKHLHHRFLQFGLPQKQVVVIFYFLTLYFGVISFLFVLIPNEYALLLLFLLVIGLFFSMRVVGFIERKIKMVHHLEARLRAK